MEFFAKKLANWGIKQILKAGAAEITTLILNENPELSREAKQFIKGIVITVIDKIDKSDPVAIFGSILNLVENSEKFEESFQGLADLINGFSGAKEILNKNSENKNSEKNKIEQIAQVSELDQKEMAQVTRTLQKKFKIKPQYLKEIPDFIQFKLLETFENSTELICPITLEKVLKKDKKGPIRKDMTIVIRADSNSDKNAFHIFFYKGKALENWYKISGTKSDPLTRAENTTQYKLS
ncbi:hypothetical protein M0811_07200 [Anaeramoeba ignava]|uniref:Uncharacterized protein n=1 Tax=Anaeramoeba ignava TaxID=1746090 RepID=A0A9Q0LPP5_ANAIG|nr:hypothetical protein M0811_07200 [Anaeramoeba ignava]